MVDRPRTDKELLFIDFLFGAAEGDVRAAMTMAGYAKTTSISSLFSTGLRDVIIERAKEFIALHAPKATLAVLGLIDDPLTPGARVKLKASTEILDRSNIVKTEEVRVDTSGGVFFLPPKDKEKDELQP